jgi:aminopeptidase N
VAPGPYATRPEIKGLTRAEALSRSAMVARADYDLALRIDGTESELSGVVNIDLDIRHVAHALTIDFAGGSVDEVVVNGRALAPQYNGLFLTIPASRLRVGRTQVWLRYRHPYSTSGVGLHRFKDPEDGRAYVYTHFEPYDANQLFPCLDQPDLKASYKLRVDAPADWTVISSVRERSTSGQPERDRKLRDHSKESGRRVWKFDRTPRFSTYLFSLHAGPFKEWKGAAGKIPLRLFAPQTLAKYVKADEWLKTTRQGLKFYGDYFARPYPFPKYDQIILYEYNGGAMENVGAVTFNADYYVHRSAETLREREGRASVILHEMAHMWFGDLVTMSWWNGLWLNESFATYMAALALHEATEFKSSWLSFFAGQKQVAYWEDQLVTTHPIDVPVDDTVTAFTNFDGITYGKGASVLKQLVFYAGEKHFRDGVRKYIAAHAWGNATLADFFGAVEGASSLSLKEWASSWLEREGLNTLETKYSCADGKVTELHVQAAAPPEHPFLRPHRTSIALYNSRMHRIARAEIGYQGSADVADLAGSSCPALVYPNDSDHDYVKVKLDARSAANMRELLPKAEDPLLRAMLWQTLWDSVRDAEMPATDYLGLALELIGAEPEIKVTSFVARTMGQAVSYLPQYGEPGSELGSAYADRVETFLWKSLGEAKPGSDFQKLWLDTFVSMAHTPDGLAKLSGLLGEKSGFKGLVVDQDRRWNVLTRLSTFDVAGVGALIESERARDHSDRAAKMAIAAESARPDPAVKKKWWDELTVAKARMSLASLRKAMGMFPRNQWKLREEYATAYFDALGGVAEHRDSNFQIGFAAHLVPALCGPLSAARLDGYVRSHSTLPAPIMKQLRIAQQEDERCAKVRALALRASGTAVQRP